VAEPVEGSLYALSLLDMVLHFASAKYELSELAGTYILTTAGILRASFPVIDGGVVQGSITSGA
jgi:hypothetical protein